MQHDMIIFAAYFEFFLRNYPKMDANNLELTLI